MRVVWLKLPLVLALALGGCSGGSGDDDDGGSGDGDGNSSSVGVVEIETISPDHGPLAGGTLITITGQGFLLGNAQPDSVLVGGLDCGPVQLIDDRTLKVVTPAAVAAGAVDVIVFNSNGYDTLTDGYRYNPLPTVATVTADEGPAVGGEAVVIAGTGFQANEPGTNLVFFGENLAANVTVSSDTQMTAITPPGEAFSLVDVAVVNDNGTGEKPAAYEYLASGEAILALARPETSGCGGCAFAGKPGYFGVPYAAPLATPQLFRVDPETGAVASVAESETWINGMARAASGTIYGVIHATRAPGELAGMLVTVNPSTGATTPVGPTGITNPINDISFVGATLFGVSYREGSAMGIHTINTATGTATGIGGSGLTNGGNGLSFDGATLYCANNYGLCQVDTGTGVVGNCVGPSLRIRALSVANDTLYGAMSDYWDYSNSVVVEVDTATGNAQPVATIPGKVTALTTLP